MADFYSWNLKHLLLNVCGIDFSGDNGGGASSGDYAKFMPDSDDWTEQVGPQGDTTRNATNNRNGVLELHIKAESGLNDRLAALRELDLFTPNGAAVGPSGLRTKHGRTVLGSGSSYIIGLPKELSFGASQGDRVWRIKMVDATVFVGGH